MTQHVERECTRLVRQTFNTSPMIPVREDIEARIERAKDLLESESDTTEIFRLQGQIQALKEALEDWQPGERVVQRNGAYTTS